MTQQWCRDVGGLAAVRCLLFAVLDVDEIVLVLVGAKQRQYKLVVPEALIELSECHHPVVVHIQQGQLGNPLLPGSIVVRAARHRRYATTHPRDLIVIQCPTAIGVKEIETQPQALLHIPCEQYRQAADKLLEVHGVRAVCQKAVESGRKR